MSMNFKEPLSDEAFAKIKKFFGEPAAGDRKTLLFNEMKVIDSSAMTEIANTAKQPATIELHGNGEIKTLSDGTRYQVTPQGWRKL